MIHVFPIQTGTCMQDGGQGVTDEVTGAHGGELTSSTSQGKLEGYCPHAPRGTSPTTPHYTPLSSFNIGENCCLWNPDI